MRAEGLGVVLNQFQNTQITPYTSERKSRRRVSTTHRSQREEALRAGVTTQTGVGPRFPGKVRCRLLSLLFISLFALGLSLRLQMTWG